MLIQQRYVCEGYSTFVHNFDCFAYLFFHPQIDMDVVFQYQPRKAIPQVTLIIQRVGDGQPTERYITVDLVGVDAPNSFLLECTPDTRARG